MYVLVVERDVVIGRVRNFGIFAALAFDFDAAHMAFEFLVE